MMAALCEIFQNSSIVNTIAIQSATISINAPNGERKPKKTRVHKKFRISCIPKMNIAAERPFALFSSMIPSAIPIRAYSSVHTGAKTQDGGLNEGLFRPEYHSGIDRAVKMLPAIPTLSQAPTVAANLRIR